MEGSRRMEFKRSWTSSFLSSSMSTATGYRLISSVEPIFSREAAPRRLRLAGGGERVETSASGATAAATCTCKSMTTHGAQVTTVRSGSKILQFYFPSDHASTVCRGGPRCEHCIPCIFTYSTTLHAGTGRRSGGGTQDTRRLPPSPPSAPHASLSRPVGSGLFRAPALGRKIYLLTFRAPAAQAAPPSLHPASSCVRGDQA